MQFVGLPVRRQSMPIRQVIGTLLSQSHKRRYGPTKRQNIKHLARSMYLTNAYTLYAYTIPALSWQ